MFYIDSEKSIEMFWYLYESLIAEFISVPVTLSGRYSPPSDQAPATAQLVALETSDSFVQLSNKQVRWK